MDANLPEALSSAVETAANAEIMTIYLPLDRTRIREHAQRFENHLTLASLAAASQGAHLDFKVSITAQTTQEVLRDFLHRAYISTIHDIEQLATTDDHTEARYMEMDVGEAYRILGIVDSTIDDETIVISFQIGVDHNPGNIEKLGRAFKAVANDRQSDMLQGLVQGDTSMADATILSSTNDQDASADASAHIGPSNAMETNMDADGNDPQGQANPVVAQCKICMDDMTANDTVATINCGCAYCITCLNAHIKHALASRASYPARCCGHDGIDIGDVAHYLTMDIIERWSEAEMEFNERLPTYCASKECSAHIPAGRLGGANKFIDCNLCMIDTCKECKQGRIAHSGEDSIVCPEDLVSKEDRELANAEKWKQCPGCKNLVERTEGCNNMM